MDSDLGSTAIARKPLFTERIYHLLKGYFLIAKSSPKEPDVYVEEEEPRPKSCWAEYWQIIVLSIIVVVCAVVMPVGIWQAVVCKRPPSCACWFVREGRRCVP